MKPEKKTHARSNPPFIPEQMPVLAKLAQQAKPLIERGSKITHVLMVMPAGEAWHDAPDADAAQATLKRRHKTTSDLLKQPLALELPGGCFSVWLRLDVSKSAFDWHTQLRAALKPVLDEQPTHIDVALYGDADFCARVARSAAYVLWANSVQMPQWKSDKTPVALQSITFHGIAQSLSLATEQALAMGNALCRRLTMLPPNFLKPASYRAHVRHLASEAGWELDEFDVKRLRKLQAGAFLAVARGSGHEDAAIVKLSYRGAKRSGKSSGKKTDQTKDKIYALVGKGICFDTGGHNLKPARYMNNMHDDMNGSAVALGILTAATRMKLPINLDVWLAIAENHLSPESYTQNEVITAMNGTSIEIVHTDAEGRMVLADTLALAAKDKPAAIIDFATLTGSMTVALGERMSGVISNRDEWIERAAEAAQVSGERVVAFPMPDDYDEALDSTVADVKQCTLDGEADHILAARFLNRFVADTPWLHMDLSASRCKGGLGAVGTDITGFGVAWCMALLQKLALKD